MITMNKVAMSILHRYPLKILQNPEDGSQSGCVT